MDDDRLRRRRSIRSLLFGKSSFCRRFQSSPENSFTEKEGRAEANLRKCSSHGSNSASSEGTSSQGSATSKRWKSPLVRSLSWIKWNLLSSLSSNYHPSHPSPFRISCSSLANRNHAISSSYEKIKPCTESGIKMIEQRKSGFEYLEKNFNEMAVKEDIEAQLRKEPVNCSSPTSNSEDAEECVSQLCKEPVNSSFPTSNNEDAEKCLSLCCGSENKLEDREIRISCCSSEKEKHGEDDDVEEGFEQKVLHGYPTEEHVSHRKKNLRRFPPPLPSLARTGNLPCHMPWVHLRSYKRDGRLVIQEVKVQHHEFFRAQRSNGRLIMHLVQHDEGKIRAHQAEKTKAQPHRNDIDSSDQDSVDQAKENDRIKTEEAAGEAMDTILHDNGDKDGAEEVPGETMDVLLHHNGDKDEAEEGPGEALGLLQEDNNDKDTVVEQEESPGFNGDFEDLNTYGGQDKFSANFGIDEREARLPHPIRIPVQQCFPAIGLESPIGCCAPPLNSLFERPITAIRPIRS